MKAKLDEEVSRKTCYLIKYKFRPVGLPIETGFRGVRPTNTVITPLADTFECSRTRPPPYIQEVRLLVFQRQLPARKKQVKKRC